MAIKASGLDYKHLATYLVEGVAWSRLRDVATLSPAQGGLGLFSHKSQARKNIFDPSPSGVVTTRPSTDLNFLRFLNGNDHILHQVM